MNLSNEFEDVVLPNGVSFKIRKNIPSSDIFTLIQSVIKDSYVDNIYNPYIMNVLFHGRFVILVTDIEPTKEEEDFFVFYDNIINKGILNKVVDTVNELYNEIFNHCLDTKEDYEKYNLSIVSGLEKLSTISDKLVKDTETTRENINSFDQEKVKEVVAFKKAIEGSSK